MSVGRAGPAGAGWRSVWSLAALLYALVLAASPLLHHDLSCELKSRTHCTSCISGVAGPGLAQETVAPTLELPRAGVLAATPERPIAHWCTRALTGRSPPAV